MVIVVKSENLSKLELFNFNFGKKRREEGMCNIYEKGIN